MPKMKDLTGMRYGRLTVICFDHRSDDYRYFWRCRCDCGNEKIVDRVLLNSGATRSCGCYNVERAIETNTTHGMTDTRLYNTWCGMKRRCDNPKMQNYYLYGGRGIRVCDEWMSFEPFMEWALANGYDDDLTIERINPDGDYCPENCRWATKIEQANNKRTNHLLTYNGETKTVAEWAREKNISYQNLSMRIRRGWTVERALEQGVGDDKWHKSAS